MPEYTAWDGWALDAWDGWQMEEDAGEPPVVPPIMSAPFRADVAIQQDLKRKRKRLIRRHLLIG